jgi:hypothetical protein
MPDAAQSNPTIDPTSPADADAHLARLHKMSTTAGVTNQGYVAVNQTAIVAAILGLVSALSFFGWLLLVVPIVGIVFAVVAIRQINDSSGTQTGKGLALAGLGLCILMGGGAITKELVAIVGVRGEEAKISDTLSKVGDYLHQGKYKEAYALHDDGFQNRFKFAQFETTWKSVQGPNSLGQIISMEWNGVSPIFETVAGSPTAVTKARAKFEKTQDERLDVGLRKVGDRWLISYFPAFFTEKRPAKKDDVFNLDKP